MEPAILKLAALSLETSGPGRCCRSCNQNQCVRLDCLGVVTDLSQAVSKRVISFWPRQSLCDKALGMISNFRDTNYLTPAMSSKFRGVV